MSMVPLRRRPLRRRGFVLVVVLILIVAMTGIAAFAVRRASTDERLVGAHRDSALLQAASDATLRYCELWLWLRPPGSAPATGLPDPPQLVAAPLRGETAAWKASDWNAVAQTALAGALSSDISTRCLFEDASTDLLTAATGGGGGAFYGHQGRGQEAAVIGAGPTAQLVSGVADGWRKYRITAQTTYQPGGSGPRRTALAQSEVRLFRAF